MAANKALKNFRNARILSQQELAEIIETSAPNVSRWERGITTPSPYFRRRLCEFFETTPEQLFPDQETSDELVGPQSTPAVADGGTRPGKEVPPVFIDPPLEELFFYKSTLPNPGEFFGRPREQRRVLHRIKGGQPASIVGSRRIGKTWLLRYLSMTARAKLGEHILIGYLDAAQASCATLPQFFATALRELKIDGPIDEEGRSSFQALELGVKEMRNRGMIPVLCIDRFERFCNIPEVQPDMLDKLRTLTQDGLCLVIASRQPLRKVILDAFGTTELSPFDNVFEQVKLGPFTRAEAEEFLRAKGERADFSDDERDKLLLYAQHQSTEQWYPEDLQWAGTLLYDDKLLAPDSYRPHDPVYWQEFERRLHEGLQEE